MRPLESHLLAAAVTRRRGGGVVVGHFGSLTREIEACHSGVGLAGRPDLAAAIMSTTADRLDLALSAMNMRVAVGGIARAAAILACRPHPTNAILLVPRRERDSLLKRCAHASPGSGATITDVTDVITAISVLGPAAEALMRGDEPLPRTGELCSLELTCGPMLVIREAPDCVTLLVDGQHVVAVWTCLLARGTELDATLVGCDALDALGMTTPQAVFQPDGTKRPS